ncbi:MAG: flagellin [SAR324 cluster bacterium]|nr:flagellin [SAR324 cluster bacterium]
MSIKHNVASLNSLRHANDAFTKVGNNIEKLTTGQSINKAADGPATLIASERLRGQIVGMQQSLDNAEFSISMVQTAEGSLNEISSMLINIRQLAVHAANEAVNDKPMVEADQSEIEHLLSSIDRIANNTIFGDKKLLDGSNGARGVTVGPGLRFVNATTDTKASPENGYEVDILQVATRAKATGTVPLTAENIGQGINLIINEGNKTAVLDTSRGEIKAEIDKIVENTRQDPQRFPSEEASQNIRTIVLTQLRKKVEESGLKVDVFTDPNGMMVVRHREFGDEPTLSVTSSVAGILSEKENIAMFAEPGKDIEGTIGGEIALGDGQFLTAVEGTKAQGLTIQYDRELGLKEVPVFDENGFEVGVSYVEETNDELVGSPSNPKSEGYVHVSQGSISFQIGPQEGQQAKLSMVDTRTKEMARGIPNESRFTSLSDIDVTTPQGARDTINMVDAAVDEITKIRGVFGSFQKNALENNLNSLKVAEENLTQAESTIRDADMAEQMSQLTGNQILLSSSTAMLAQANQVPQSVLGLITGQGG